MGIIMTEKVINSPTFSIYLLIFLPVSAKSCIFAAEIGVKTCRYIPQKQYTILLTPAKWYIVINPFYLEIVEILNNISRLELHIFEFVV